MTEAAICLICGFVDCVEVGTRFHSQPIETNDFPISQKSYLTTVFRSSFNPRRLKEYHFPSQTIACLYKVGE